MSMEQELQTTIADLVKKGKGLLAADESAPTIEKRFRAVGIESTEEQRRAYRSLLLTAQGAGEYLSGVIFFEETLGQADPGGTPLPKVAERQGIVPGIKVDKGTTALANASGDLVTQGLDGLAERLSAYKRQGARFAKWREVYSIGEDNPSALGIDVNADTLARYASICQSCAVVPIVEPEVLLDGRHSMQRCAEVTENVLHAVFHALHRHRVILECMILKPSMVLPGKESTDKAAPQEVAHETVRVLRRTVPSAVPSINFLSGGQSPVQASANLQAINALDPNAPWSLSFSYARALQEPVLDAWRGKPSNVAPAQKEFLHRLRCNAAAALGKYGERIEADRR